MTSVSKLDTIVYRTNGKQGISFGIQRLNGYFYMGENSWVSLPKFALKFPSISDAESVCNNLEGCKIVQLFATSS